MVPLNRLLLDVQDRLREFAVSLDVEAQEPDAGVDAVVTLSRNGQRQRYAAVVKEQMTVGSLAHGAHRPLNTLPYPPLIIGDRINRRSAAAFRASGMQFIDALGNAFIRFGDVLIEVQGRAEPTVTVTHGRPVRRHRPTNIFSARRSQVILALLTWPELSTSKVREIAAAAGVSTGQAHDAVVQLQETGFLTPTSRKLCRAGELLDLWTAAYPTGLGKRLEIATFHGDPSRPLSGSDDAPFHLSGESAEGSGVVRPATLTVYVDHFDPKLPIRNRWDADTTRAPNVFVRQKFWTSPHGEGGSRPRVRTAPWPLVYADLLATRDARLREVAETWRARRARSD